MSTGPLNVLADANILFSRTIREWFCLCHLETDPPLFQLYWTEDIVAELAGALRERNPYYNDAQVDGVRRRIVATLPEGEIGGFSIDTARTYRDLKDVHVHSAAVHGHVDILLTDNVKDLKADDSDDLPYEALTAGEFLLLVDDSCQELVLEVTRKQFQYYSDRTDSFSLPGSLERAGAKIFAERVANHLRADHC